MARKIEREKVLIVEGQDEERFFGAMIEHLGLGNIQVMGIGGKDKLRQSLRMLSRAPDFARVTALGVIRDADRDPSAAFQSVCDALRGAGLHAPETPLELVAGHPKVGVMIVPGESRPGTLEDICLESVAEDVAMPCVEQYFECLRGNGCDLPAHVAKAKVQVFLASRSRVCLRLGEAAQAGYWPWGAAAFKEVKGFLQRIGS